MSLIGTKSFDKIILVDVVKSITDKLIELVTDIPEDEINVLLEDCSIIKIDNKLSKTVTIAGIGGKLSIRIVENLRLQLAENDIIILSAHNNLEEVRCYLVESGLLLIEERLVTENSKFYEVLVLSNSKGYTVPKVGYFKDSDLIIKKDYFKKCIKYFDTKAKFLDDETSKSYLELYNQRLEEINL